jgi:hypothetical protein
MSAAMELMLPFVALFTRIASTQMQVHGSGQITRGGPITVFRSSENTHKSAMHMASFLFRHLGCTCASQPQLVEFVLRQRQRKSCGHTPLFLEALRHCVMALSRALS